MTSAKRLLNLGCGKRWHADWINVDVNPAAPQIIKHDLRKPLPFADESFEAVYHSHVLEHLPRALALPFLRECYRVLSRGGILRIAAPDLETVARLYLEYLDKAWRGKPKAAARYEWMTLELLDQMTRDHSGGEMLQYWKQNPMPEEEFVLSRMGDELRSVLGALRMQEDSAERPPPAPAEVSDAEWLRFFRSGELHRWMYDRYSLRLLLESAGFMQTRLCAATESEIPEFSGYCLDANEQGAPRKPDSLFMEAHKA